MYYTHTHTYIVTYIVQSKPLELNWFCLITTTNIILRPHSRVKNWFITQLIYGCSNRAHHDGDQRKLNYICICFLHTWIGICYEHLREYIKSYLFQLSPDSWESLICRSLAACLIRNNLAYTTNVQMINPPIKQTKPVCGRHLILFCTVRTFLWLYCNGHLDQWSH